MTLPEAAAMGAEASVHIETHRPAPGRCVSCFSY